MNIMFKANHPEGINKYTQMMSKSTTWGDAWTLKAISKLLEWDVIIFNQTGSKYEYESSKVKHRVPIFLGYINNLHYQSLILVPIQNRTIIPKEINTGSDPNLITTTESAGNVCDLNAKNKS